MVFPPVLLIKVTIHPAQSRIITISKNKETDNFGPNQFFKCTFSTMANHFMTYVKKPESELEIRRIDNGDKNILKKIRLVARLTV